MQNAAILCRFDFLGSSLYNHHVDDSIKNVFTY